MTSEQVAKVLSSLGKRKVCFQHGDKIEIIKGINVTNDNVILISELPSGHKQSMRWEVKYSNILNEEKFIYYPYLDDMGHVTDPYQLWYNEFKAAGKDVDTYLGAEITE